MVNYETLTQIVKIKRLTRIKIVELSASCEVMVIYISGRFSTILGSSSQNLTTKWQFVVPIQVLDGVSRHAHQFITSQFYTLNFFNE